MSGKLLDVSQVLNPLSVSKGRSQHHLHFIDEEAEGLRVYISHLRSSK